MAFFNSATTILKTLVANGKLVEAVEKKVKTFTLAA